MSRGGLSRAHTRHKLALLTLHSPRSPTRCTRARPAPPAGAAAASPRCSKRLVLSSQAARRAQPRCRRCERRRCVTCRLARLEVWPPPASAARRYRRLKGALGRGRMDAHGCPSLGPAPAPLPHCHSCRWCMAAAAAAAAAAVAATTAPTRRQSYQLH